MNVDSEKSNLGESIYIHYKFDRTENSTLKMYYILDPGFTLWGS